LKPKPKAPEATRSSAEIRVRNEGRSIALSVAIGEDKREVVMSWISACAVFKELEMAIGFGRLQWRAEVSAMLRAAAARAAELVRPGAAAEAPSSEEVAPVAASPASPSDPRDAEIAALRALLEQAHAVASGSAWGDEPLPEDDAIQAAFPTRSGEHEAYAEALRLVGARRSKSALVELVTWLLVERKRARRDEQGVAG